jgi:hypothetical protein
MERKFNQEKSLREVAETRVKALKKKVRAYENAASITTSTTNGGNSNSSSITPPTINLNDTSIDAGNGTAATTNVGNTTLMIMRDDESVGTHQTQDKSLQSQQQQQQQQQQQILPPPPSSAAQYSDQIQL